MRAHRMLLLAGLWLSSLGLAGYAASQREVVSPNAEGVILTGENLGFRMEGRQGNALTGTLVVKIDGKWVEARSAVKVVPVK